MGIKSNLPEVIDLFSGCGGFALGFQSAGFDVTHGIELMQEAVNNVSYNLDWRFKRESAHICGDITTMDPNVLSPKIGPNGCIVIGGPPCQAYSLAGRAKLNSLSNDGHTSDSRGFLYNDFIRFALGLNAEAIVMENVPEAVSFGDKNIPEEVSACLSDNGYNVFWTILNAADYGVPQIRERMFVIAVKDRDKGFCPLPSPTHSAIDKKSTLNELRFDDHSKCKYFKYPIVSKSKKKWVTVREALSDLPSLFKSSKDKYQLYPPNLLLPYQCDCLNDYQKIMRNWYKRPSVGVSGNGFKKTLRDYPIFEKMQPGDCYIEASLIADKILEETCVIRRVRVGSEEYLKLKKDIVPPYSRDKFKSKWKKLDEVKPAHTVVAHLSVDTYSHIHPWEPRGISVREAARLQSFPDGYVFQTSMTDSYKQIGNAVPPLLAKAIAQALKKYFKGEKK